MKILLAEDDAISSLLMRRTLQSFGYEVVLAQNGQQAAEILAQPDGPRLALVDWMMPELDGLSLCREVRSHQVDGSYIYILLLTSKQDSQDIVAGLEAGADDYLTKPCQAAELRARLRTGRRILSLEEKLVQAREEMRHKATHDGLTGIWNRSAILSLSRNELLRSARRQSSLSVLLCDVDHFKKINDNYGHLTGDLVLQEIARRLRSAVRDSDAVGRYGGEEFLIVLNDCPESVLHSRADAIRDIVSSTPILANEHHVPVTMSIGGATRELKDGETSIEQLLASADSALYEAKRQGRNRALLSERLVMH
jgi:two-component system, cell cycle response regulator